MAPQTNQLNNRHIMDWLVEVSFTKMDLKLLNCCRIASKEMKAEDIVEICGYYIKIKVLLATPPL